MEKTDWLNRLSQQHAESLTFQGSLIPLTSLGGEITTSLSHIYPASCFFLSFCWCQAHSASCWVCQVCVRSEMLNHYLLFRDLPCVCRAARTSLGLCTAFAVVKYCTPTWKHKTTVNVFMHRHTQTHLYFFFDILRVWFPSSFASHCGSRCEKLIFSR